MRGQNATQGNENKVWREPIEPVHPVSQFANFCIETLMLSLGLVLLIVASLGLAGNATSSYVAIGIAFVVISAAALLINIGLISGRRRRDGH
ncbi:MAG: hypothetical protein HY432_01950 [Candidatus Liptonbacteria bacterium]|nr:hypothetical protein [Candidatus Liptonbacteria bacterium]